MFPENVRYERNGNIGQVHVTYRMVCSDDGAASPLNQLGKVQILKIKRAVRQ